MKLPMTFEAMQQDGPPLRVRDLVTLTGLSHRTILLDITSGDLKAIKRSKGKQALYLIHRTDAREYCHRLGFGALAKAG